jgi:SAM-dependent methyltransferase
MTMSNFGLYSKYYDLLYREKDYSGESNYVLNLIQRHGENAERKQWNILELGCGSGGHAAFIAPTIHQLVGVERSHEMAEQAVAKKIGNFQILEGDITQLNKVLPDDYKNESFDAVISLFHVVSYINQNDDLWSCLMSVYNSLKPGGVFVFDVWFAPAVFWLRPERRVKHMSDDLIHVERTANSSINVMSNVVTVKFDTQIIDNSTGESTTLQETHPMRCYGVPEISLLAQEVGMQVVCVEEFLSGKPASVETWGVCFVLKKNK